MNNYDYFDAAESHANNFSNANGQYGWQGFTGDGYNYMDNGGVGAEAPSNANPSDSLPYVIIVTNSTASAVSSVVILGANVNTGSGVTNFGNVAAITITMDSGDTTYAQFLESIKSQPFKVGLTHIEGSSSAQTFKAWTFTEKSSNGRVTTYPVTPRLDALQQQNTVTLLKNKYTVDAWTQLSTTIVANGTLTVSIYPMNELNVARGLEGRQVEKNYAAPGLSSLPGVRY